VGAHEDRTSSGEVNSPCGKVLLRKTLERRTRGGLKLDRSIRAIEYFHLTSSQSFVP